MKLKLKLMIALVIMALVFGMTFTACDDGDAPEIKNTIKDDGTVTNIIYDDLIIGDYDKAPKKGDGSANPDFGKYKPASPKPDTTNLFKQWYNGDNEPVAPPASPIPDGYYFKWEVPGWPSIE